MGWGSRVTSWIGAIQQWLHDAEAGGHGCFAASWFMSPTQTKVWRGHTFLMKTFSQQNLSLREASLEGVNPWRSGLSKNSPCFFSLVKHEIIHHKAIYFQHYFIVMLNSLTISMEETQWISNGSSHLRDIFLSWISCMAAFRGSFGAIIENHITEPEVRGETSNFLIMFTPKSLGKMNQFWSLHIVQKGWGKTTN